MRMWMVNPKLMCFKHLHGEHLECHMFLGSVLKKMNLKGFIEEDCLEPESIAFRHRQIIDEMMERGHYKVGHEELVVPDGTLDIFLPEQRLHRIDAINSFILLNSRCSDCRKISNDFMQKDRNAV